tara:strand:- start:176 stop:571 length:396 start_codon:yes stop_codon:yes gene_type:complete
MEMEKIENFSKQETKFLAGEMLKELKPLMEKYGLTIDRKGASYGGHFVDIKFHVEVPQAAAQSQENDFNRYAQMYGINAPFGFSYTQRGMTFTVEGINHNKPKNRISLKRNDGKKYQCDVESINRAYSMFG